MAEKKAPPRGPVAIESVAWDEWGQGARYQSRMRVLSDTVETTNHIGVAVEELQPGKQSAPFHYHLLEEEHVIVLEGSMTLRLGEEELPLKAGDYCCFPAGRSEGHCFIDRRTEACRYIIIGDRNPNEVCVYPDSNKVLIRGFNRKIIRDGAQLDYWDSEKADEPL